jgi:helix-turn-helix protein
MATVTTAEREELNRLRRENRVLREEREILSKARPGSRRRPARCRHGVPIRERESGHVRGCHDVPGAGRLRQWLLLCVAQAAAIRTGARRRGTHFTHHRDSSILAWNLWRAAVHEELLAAGIQVVRKRVARLMRATGLCGVSRRQWVTTTVRDSGARPAPDLVERNFAAAAPQMAKRTV